MTRAVPSRRFLVEAMSGHIHALALDAPRRDALLNEWGWTGRRVFGFKLPEWQRDPCWDEGRSSAFIESVYLGASIGAYMLNVGLQPEHDLVLLDGQQRLRAVEDYLAGRIAVRGEDGVARTWNELEAEDRMRFLRVSFPWLKTEYRDEATMREAYLRHNFGGVPHAPEDRPDPGSFAQAPGLGGR